MRSPTGKTLALFRAENCPPVDTSGVKIVAVAFNVALFARVSKLQGESVMSYVGVFRHVVRSGDCSRRVSAARERKLRSLAHRIRARGGAHATRRVRQAVYDTISAKRSVSMREQRDQNDDRQWHTENQQQ